MRLYNLDDRIEAGHGETVLGATDLSTHACYLIYGKLTRGKPPMRLKPGAGHEEIILVVDGAIDVDDGAAPRRVEAGQAFHLVGEMTLQATAATPTAIYAVAGGHSARRGHSH